MKDLGLCDEAVEVDKSNKIGLGKLLGDRSIDTLFCPHQSMTSHRAVKKIKAKTKIGYYQFWNASYFDKRIHRKLSWPEAIRQLQLLASVFDKVELNLEAFAERPNSVPQWAEMSLNHFPWTESNLGQLAKEKLPGFKINHPYVCIAPGSVWPTKRWLEESFTRVATHFARENFQVVIIGAPDERDLCERIYKQVPNSFCLAGHLSVRQSMMFLWKAKGLVCNDSGAMHMASVVRCPTVAIFGPTVEELGYKPWNPLSLVIQNNELLCRPCGQHGSRLCPIGTLSCMRSVKPNRVIEATQSIFR